MTEKFDGKKIDLADDKLKERLNSEQFRVLRRAGTEKPFANAYFNEKREGLYLCAACSLPLFSSLAKYDSGTGWPSFFAPIFPQNVAYHEDKKLFSVRTEVVCARCDSHLGHVFDDGPPPSGKRYCMNSAALAFDPQPL